MSGKATAVRAPRVAGSRYVNAFMKRPTKSIRVLPDRGEASGN